MNPSPALAIIAADPQRITDVPPEQVPELIGEAAALQAALLLRLHTATRHAPPSHAPEQPDRLLTAREAAERLGVGARWIYRRADQLPFTRKLSGGTLRFSERGLERWKESRR